jgi:hypothetical protein
MRPALELVRVPEAVGGARMVDAACTAAAMGAAFHL